MYIFKKESDIVKIWNQTIVKNLKNSGLIKKTDNILDYGCGLGTWDNEASNNGIFFNKLYLYDKNSEIRGQCKKNYPNVFYFNSFRACIISSFRRHRSCRRFA